MRGAGARLPRGGVSVRVAGGDGGKEAAVRGLGRYLLRLVAAACVLLSGAWAQEVDYARSGSTGNRIVFEASNHHPELPMTNLRVEVAGAPRMLRNFRVEPASIQVLDPGQSAEFAVVFDVPEQARAGQQEEVALTFTAQDGVFLEPEMRLTIEVTSPGSVTACALGESAPDTVEAAQVFSYCEPRVTRLYLQDRTAVFVKPSGNVPVDRPGGFAYRIRDQRGETLTAGQYLSQGPASAGAMVRAATGAPGEFVVVLPPNFLAGRASLAEREQARIYTVETSALSVGPGGLLGASENSGTPVGDWLEEGTFELWDPVLYYQGFVTERYVDKAMGPGYPGGQFLVDKRESGTGVILDLSAQWQNRATGEPQRMTGSLELTFPEALLPDVRTMGEIQARFDNDVSTGDTGLLPISFTVGINLLVATRQGPWRSPNS